MRRAFPKLSDDAFPHLENVDPYRRKVPFDYGRYDYMASIKLCSVPWPSDYKHVVNWHGTEARDSYFERLDGRTIELDNGFTRTQLDSVRVNVPYDMALTYNYVYMQVPQLTEDEPINHEGTTGVRTVCAWIQDAIYMAPSATELVLEVDVWTTYLPHLARTTLMLHRGHAPAYATSVDAYLANPKAMCTDLLTPDVSFGESDVTASSNLIDIAQGSKMIVLASTIPYGEVASLTLAQQVSGSTTPASFYDTGTRDGHQVGVSGYEWHYGGRSYEDMRNPSAYGGVGGSMASYTYLYAISASNARNDLSTLASRLPQLIKSTRAAFILPKRALTLAGTTYAIAGVTIYRVVPDVHMRELARLNLKKAAFDYPDRYADIAKLYTYPYAHLVVSDTLGNDIMVRVEDIGSNPRIMEQLSPMAECLRWDVVLDGVNAAGTNAYTWTALDGSERQLTLPGADLARYTIELGIPTYALYLDGRVAHAMDAYADAQAQRASAINTYQSTMRSANTGMENAHDSADTAKTNADASADTAKANADASANTAKANADASANTSMTNTANSGNNSLANATIQNNTRTTSTTRSNTLANSLRDISNAHIFNSLYADDEYTMQASDINLKNESVAGALSTVGSLASGNVVGAVSNGLSAIVNITTSQGLSILSSENIEVKEAIGQKYQTDTTAQNVANATDQTTYANTANTNTTTNNVNTANTNATNSANTAKSNASRTQATTKANASATQVTSKANAARTQATTKANASHSRSTTETNAKLALDLARQNYARQGHAHDLDNPVAFGAASGDRTADALMRRVIQVRVETQSKGAIARAGDVMRRYGYMYDGLWDVADWCPGDHDGCYWEASDVLVSASAIDNPTAERTYEAILMQGTTVWDDPAKIGGLPW